MPLSLPGEMSGLLEGYNKFRGGYFSKKEDVFKELASQGQKPKTMIISCSDSRVDPTIIMKSSPGEVFSARHVASLVPDYFDRPKNESIGAALEFAVRYLEVQQIIVLGHSSCGGIKTLLETEATKSGDLTPPPERNFIQDWVKIANAARDKVRTEHKDLAVEEQAKLCEEQALLVSIKNLETYPWIRLKMQSGQLSLHAWRFNIKAGLLQAYNPDTKNFEDLSSANLEKKRPTSTRTNTPIRSSLVPGASWSF